MALLIFNTVHQQNVSALLLVFPPSHEMSESTLRCQRHSV